MTLNLLLGKLNTEIMTNNVRSAKETFTMLKNKLEEDYYNKKYWGDNYHMLVNFRGYLIHAALYLFIK